MEKEFMYVYKISFSKFVYIGQHRTKSMNDCYMGSGKILNIFKSDEKLNNWFMKNAKKEIICFCNNKLELNMKEQQYIKEYKEKYEIRCLNANIMTTKNDKIRYYNFFRKLIDEVYIFNYEEYSFIIYCMMKNGDINYEKVIKYMNNDKYKHSFLWYHKIIDKYENRHKFLNNIRRIFWRYI